MKLPIFDFIKLVQADVQRTVDIRRNKEKQNQPPTLVLLVMPRENGFWNSHLDSVLNKQVAA